jgi:hypothetical protein
MRQTDRVSSGEGAMTIGDRKDRDDGRSHGDA